MSFFAHCGMRMRKKHSQVCTKRTKIYRNMKLIIVGAGNIGGAVACGLLEKNSVKASDVSIVDVNESRLKEMAAQYAGIRVSSSNEDRDAWVKESDVVIVAVKPWLVDEVIGGIAASLTGKQSLCVIAAGVDFKQIDAQLKTKVASFRVMPNTAMTIGESMTLISSQRATKEQEEQVMWIFNNLGKAVLIPENMQGAATSVCSCGIAYALRYLRAAVEGAVEMGFRADVAHEMVAQTMKGAAELILKNHSHAEAEIDKVCTPGGWTIKGLNEMEAQGFTNSVIKGITINK